MRILIDLQACQAANRGRGIDRYAMALIRAMAKEAAGRHELWVALNGSFPETILPLRAALAGSIPRERIAVYHLPEGAPDHGLHRRTAELLRENFLAGLAPDLVVLSSLFEGLGNGAATSAGPRGVATAAILYDLIPLAMPESYLREEHTRAWYYRKLQALKELDLLLAISEHTRQEAITLLNLPAERVINISAAADSHFRPQPFSPAKARQLLGRFGLGRPFVMYTGGIDPRKNIEGLIAAYAGLPPRLRAAHQLAVICALRDEDRKRLARLAAGCGLGSGEVIFTGRVSEEELVGLYNLCHLFVFPSLAEGFGLPLLEAMACGAPVLGAARSSIPELVGRKDALFDPHKPAAITEALSRALTDEPFRRELRLHGLQQASRFSWRESAARALAALETLQAKRAATSPCVPAEPKPRLAYVSPLPPAQTGIADYSAELLPELARFYDIELVVDQRKVAHPWLNANFPVRDLAWLESNAHRLDRILYHFGNSHFHARFFALLEQHPGVVALHDFFLSGVVHWMGHNGYPPEGMRRALYQGHGYPALLSKKNEGPEAAVWRYPCNRAVLEQAVGIISHSGYALRAAREWYGPEPAGEWRVVPQLRATAPAADRQATRQALGLAEDDFVVCTFGLLGKHKLNQQLLDAWLASSLAADPRCRLVFVGQSHPGPHDRALRQKIAASPAGQRLRITGFLEPDRYQAWLNAADLAIQLRGLSRGETSRAVLDCLAHGLPLIINANGPQGDYGDDFLIKLADDFSGADLSAALELLRQDPVRRAKLGLAGQTYVRQEHHPARAGELYRDAIEHCYAKGQVGRERRLLQELIALAARHNRRRLDLPETARTLAANRRGATPAQLLVDITELVSRDAKSGIQRVVRNILTQLLTAPPDGFRVEPVYSAAGGYLYARHFSGKLLGLNMDGFSDEPVEARAGDVFLGLDLALVQLPSCRPALAAMRRAGVRLHFVLYDLLPLLQPHNFPAGGSELFRIWLETVLGLGDGLLCISRAVADEAHQWLALNPQPLPLPLTIDFFHLGADFAPRLEETDALSEEAELALTAARQHPALLMVGTIEPRKGHAQVLAACEQLWQEGREIRLIIVGRQGWLTEEFITRLRCHPQRNRRLFWLEGLADPQLEKLYASAACLIAASFGEGFGLPLIEAARHGLPILARDIPVFREVAGEQALYFQGESGPLLAAALENWLTLHEQKQVPDSARIPRLTWEESTGQLCRALFTPGRQPLYTITPLHEE
jgi:glycosyltransferase involved in cell wall biosynthesis